MAEIRAEDQEDRQVFLFVRNEKYDMERLRVGVKSALAWDDELQAWVAVRIEREKNDRDSAEV